MRLFTVKNENRFGDLNLAATMSWSGVRGSARDRSGKPEVRWGWEGDLLVGDQQMLIGF